MNIVKCIRLKTTGQLISNLPKLQAQDFIHLGIPQHLRTNITNNVTKTNKLKSFAYCLCLDKQEIASFNGKPYTFVFCLHGDEIYTLGFVKEVKKYYHRTGKITTKSFYTLKEIWDFDESKRMVERNRIKTAIQF